MVNFTLASQDLEEWSQWHDSSDLCGFSMNMTDDRAEESIEGKLWISQALWPQ